MKRVLARHRAIALAYALTALLFVITTIISPGFAGANNLAAVATQSSFIALVGLGQTFVIIGGGIDLSIPSVLTGSAVLTTVLSHGSNGPLLWVIPLILAFGVIVGLINGAGVAFIGVSPIVMTLGLQGILQGALLIYTKGTGGSQAPPAIAWISTHKVGGIPVEVMIWVALAALAALILTRTTYGRRLYALGTSATVAEFSGVNTRHVTVLSYVISALAGVVAGILIAGYIGQSYLSLGDVYLFSSIAAVAIGGASILGGSGHYMGTVAGALTLTILAALLNILNFKPAVLQIAYGAVILVTVALANSQARAGRS